MVIYANRMPRIARSHLSDCNHIMSCHETHAHLASRCVMTVLSEFGWGLTKVSASGSRCSLNVLFSYKLADILKRE